MAIVKMKKFDLLIFESQKNALIETFQKFSEIQFINLQEENKEELNFLNNDSGSKIISELESNQAKVKFTLEFLNKYIPREKGIKVALKPKKSLKYNEFKNLAKEVNWQNIYKTLKEKEKILNSFKTTILQIETDIQKLTPLKKLDVSFKELESINSCKCFLGKIPKRFIDKFREEFENEIPECYIEEVSDIKEEVNLLIVVHKDLVKHAQKIMKKYNFNEEIFNYESIPKTMIEELNFKMKQIKDIQQNTFREIKNYNQNLEDLQIVYEYFENEIIKAKSYENFLKTDKVIAISGWVPKHLCKEMENIIQKVSGKYYYIEFKEPEENENVPILLKNNSLVKPFEAITEMYSMPKYSELDPTPLLMPFYGLFFGMMLSDAGYGLVMSIVTFLILKFVPLEKEKRSFIKLFFYLGFPTILWGVLYGTYFGGIINIPALWIKPENNITLILIVSVALGLIHLYVGLGIKAYMLIKKGRSLDAFFDVGLWYITLTASILFLIASFVSMPILLQNKTIFKYIMIAGMVGLVLTQGRESKGIVGKIGGGIYGLYGITGYVGDMVSYSRLMALGLATGFIGAAFNLMITLLGKGIVAWIFGPIIFVVGHMFNLFINALGAYVHTCRLQYLEYFSKFYEGGGKKFNPLKIKNKFIKIINS